MLCSSAVGLRWGLRRHALPIPPTPSANRWASGPVGGQQGTRACLEPPLDEWVKCALTHTAALRPNRGRAGARRLGEEGGEMQRARRCPIAHTRSF